MLSAKPLKLAALGAMLLGAASVGNSPLATAVMPSLQALIAADSAAGAMSTADKLDAAEQKLGADLASWRQLDRQLQSRAAEVNKLLEKEKQLQSQCQELLAQFRQAGKSDGPVRVAGAVYTRSQLQEQIRVLEQALKNCKGQVKQYQAIIDCTRKKQEAVQDHIQKVESTIELLRAHRRALEVQELLRKAQALLREAERLGRQNQQVLNRNGLEATSNPVRPLDQLITDMQRSDRAGEQSASSDGEAEPAKPEPTPAPATGASPAAPQRADNSAAAAAAESDPSPSQDKPKPMPAHEPAAKPAPPSAPVIPNPKPARERRTEPNQKRQALRPDHQRSFQAVATGSDQKPMPLHEGNSPTENQTPARERPKQKPAAAQQADTQGQAPAAHQHPMPQPAPVEQDNKPHEQEQASEPVPAAQLPGNNDEQPANSEGEEPKPSGANGPESADQTAPVALAAAEQKPPAAQFAQVAQTKPVPTRQPRQNRKVRKPTPVKPQPQRPVPIFVQAQIKRRTPKVQARPAKPAHKPAHPAPRQNRKPIFSQW